MIGLLETDWKLNYLKVHTGYILMVNEDPFLFGDPSVKVGKFLIVTIYRFINVKYMNVSRKL